MWSHWTLNPREQVQADLGPTPTPNLTVDREKAKMATVRNLKIKMSTCKRLVKELDSYEKEVEREAAKTVDMKDKGADPYDLKQQENVLAESRMMIPDCRKRLEAAMADLKGTLVELEEVNQEGPEIEDARSTITELMCFAGILKGLR
ncbi:hypothetical protein ACOSQ4_014297 [Xanthoceras sorbifolium]